MGIKFFAALVVFMISGVSWSQTKKVELNLAQCDTTLKKLTAVNSNATNCPEKTKATSAPTADNSYIQQSVEYECVAEGLPKNIKAAEDIAALRIVSFSGGVGVGNDNHFTTYNNDDFGLTWYKEINAEATLKNRKNKILILKYDYFGGQYTQDLGSSTTLTPDGGRYQWDQKKYNEQIELGINPSMPSVKKDDKIKYQDFEYLKGNYMNGDGTVSLKNQKSLSKETHQLSGKYYLSPAVFLTSAIGKTYIDGDDNQALAEIQRRHHQTNGLYNFNYKDFAGQVEGFSENVSYLFTKVGIGKDFKGEFFKGRCSLKATPEISVQKNIKLHDKENVISSWQPKAMITLETGVFTTKNDNPENRKRVELISNVTYDPKERLPTNVDPGSAGSVTTSLRLNFYTKDLKFSKNAATGYQIGFYVIPISISKGFGDAKNVLPSNTFGGTNEFISKWVVGGIVITPSKRKNGNNNSKNP